MKETFFVRSGRVTEKHEVIHGYQIIFQPHDQLSGELQLLAPDNQVLFAVPSSKMELGAGRTKALRSLEKRLRNHVWAERWGGTPTAQGRRWHARMF